MYAITGITGKVGGALARALLADRLPVRAVIRDIEKGRFWASQGCEIARAEMQDPASLTAAFTGTDGVFILFPSEFDPGPGFPEARAVIAAVKAALESARPNKVVCLSTIGAQSTKSNLLTQRTLMEQALGELPMPMVATADIGQVASELLQQNWTGKRVVELEGPKRVSPQEIGTIFAKILGHAVRVEVVPRKTWQALFESQGMLHPLPRIQMLDGFNEGWIDFEGGQASTIKGKVELQTVLQELVDRAG